VTSAISTRSLERIGLFTVLAAGALMPFDAPIARHMQLAHERGGASGNSIATVLNTLGDPGTVIAPLGMITLGWATHEGTLRDVGLHSAESVVLGSGVTALIKGTIGRSRPTPGSTDADDFDAGAGFRSNQQSSFPSGHTTAAFALATTLALEAPRYAPDHVRAIQIASYTVATSVGFARMYTNHHWASDVALGAGIGTLSGLMVERHVLQRMASHAGPAGRAIPSSIGGAPDGGMMVGWGKTF
jgi:membrane-associated phospholipid phosphatase